jgi:flavorubredoxin
MSALYVVNALRPKTKFLSVVASYGWASNAIETITTMMTGLKAETIEPFLVRGLPRQEDLLLVDRLAETIATKHAEAGLG